MAHWSEILGDMLRERWFWGILTLLVLLWYSTVTVYVAIKGVGDIRSMLRTLKARPNDRDGEPPGSGVLPPSREGEEP